jgi:hypothetical protein
MGFSPRFTSDSHVVGGEDDVHDELLAVAHEGDPGKVWEFLAQFGVGRY